MPDISAILWDMDGVLADTAALHYETWKSVLETQGIPFNRDLFNRMFGRNNYDSLTLLLGHPPPPALLLQIEQQKEGAFRSLLPGRIRLLPGVGTWLEIFQRRGLPQVVASSAPSENITAVIETLGIAHFFAALVAGHDMPGKPDPMVFLEAARRVHALPSECLVIEDTPAGVAAARAAGMMCLAVCTTHPPEALQSAHLVLPTLERLQEPELYHHFAIGDQP
jgi:HAD superfamily hydrolase (TIGR01509 family)